MKILKQNKGISININIIPSPSREVRDHFRTTPPETHHALPSKPYGTHQPPCSYPPHLSPMPTLQTKPTKSQKFKKPQIKNKKPHLHPHLFPGRSGPSPPRITAAQTHRYSPPRLYTCSSLSEARHGIYPWNPSSKKYPQK